MSKVFIEDISKIIADEHIPWNKLRDSSILITGATGLIGSMLVHTLFAASQRWKLDLRIFGMGRNYKAARQFDTYERFCFIHQDICEPLKIGECIDYVFHCAAITKSAEMAENPVGVIETAMLGTMNLLKLALKKRVMSVVYLSSMEVYGVTDKTSVLENDLGYIDLAKSRSSYPESKRMCENLCNSYFAQHGLPVKIIRLAQTFGAGTAMSDTRVFAQFAKNVMNGTDIVLHTDGMTKGNYCYTADAVRALLLILLNGDNGAAYNVTNPVASVTVREMANIVAHEIGGGNIKVVTDIPKDVDKFGYAPTTGYILNIDKIKSLDWEPQYGLKEMYERMLSDWWGNKND